jgi:hypothetical protein
VGGIAIRQSIKWAIAVKAKQISEAPDCFWLVGGICRQPMQGPQSCYQDLDVRVFGIA